MASGSSAKLLSDQDSLGAMLSLLDPKSLFRAEAVARPMKSAALLVWMHVCKQAWPHSKPTSADEARALCSAYGASTLYPGGGPPRHVVVVPLLEFNLQVSLAQPDGTAKLVYACTFYGEELLSLGVSFDAPIWTSPKDSSIVAAPDLTLKRNIRPKFRAALFVQRNRGDVACIGMNRTETSLPAHCEELGDEEFFFDMCDELPPPQGYFPRSASAHNAASRAFEAAPCEAYGGNAKWSSHILLRLVLAFQPLPKLPPPPEELDDDAYEAYGDYNSQEDCWYAKAERHKRVTSMQALISCEARVNPFTTGAWSDGPNSRGLCDDDMMLMLNSLTWQKLKRQSDG